jgi:hypothetical protein
MHASFTHSLSVGCAWHVRPMSSADAPYLGSGDRGLPRAAGGRLLAGDSAVLRQERRTRSLVPRRRRWLEEPGWLTLACVPRAHGGDCADAAIPR